jgi:hypothetical protein
MRSVDTLRKKLPLKFTCGAMEEIRKLRPATLVGPFAPSGR